MLCREKLLASHNILPHLHRLSFKTFILPDPSVDSIVR